MSEVKKSTDESNQALGGWSLEHQRAFIDNKFAIFSGQLQSLGYHVRQITKYCIHAENGDQSMSCDISCIPVSWPPPWEVKLMNLSNPAIVALRLSASFSVVMDIAVRFLEGDAILNLCSDYKNHLCDRIRNISPIKVDIHHDISPRFICDLQVILGNDWLVGVNPNVQPWRPDYCHVEATPSVIGSNHLSPAEL